jgi:cellulose synthase/poly-beta-1,6-N-acetylglucosamine synthase-like glycosyltransferase
VVFEIIFLVSSFLLLHTYVFYPLLVIILSVKRKNNQQTYSREEELPAVSIIMAVRNQEGIIRKKIESVFTSGYPAEKITFYLGSDASTDDTDKIIEEFKIKYPRIIFERFAQRTGKIEIINKLASQASDQILIFTDAHAIFYPESIYHLVKHFKNPEINVVGGKMDVQHKNHGTIAYQEKSYFKNEYAIKYAEGKLWGSMMGAFGSFYALRRSKWFAVPANFIGDDFYISLKAIEKGGKAIFEPEAVVGMGVSESIKEEFRRKSRIATGNFQNLFALYPMLIPKRPGLSFSFFSHKVLRWLGPVFIFVAIISLGFIFRKNLLYTILFIATTLCLLIPIIDYFHVKYRNHVILLRFITHFFYMNIAMLTGMFRFMKGVKSNVWEPTKRD